ncbi:MAG: deoxynucleoside kinase [Oscillospiraceae bacterium]|nr:deoxynucleoside kinase [Oscillospiraceae bacterium]MCL2277944.1 deoxynucleoside kinase [Oscillospiraceae bacterium]
MYITVEGCIGSGKTSLVNELNKTLKYAPLIEDFSNNPFLSGFYTDDPSSLFPTEIAFLLIHYKQLLSVNAEGNIISDFSIMSNMVFGEVNLIEPRGKSIFLKLYEYLETYLPKPDVTILLQCDSGLLHKRIKKRNQLHDASITFEYLDKINSFYKNKYKHILCENSVKVVEVNAGEFDFINNRSDFEKLSQIILREIN